MPNNEDLWVRLKFMIPWGWLFIWKWALTWLFSVNQDSEWLQGWIENLKEWLSNNGCD